MTEPWTKRFFPVALGLCGLWICNSGLAAMAIPFEAVYEVTVNGKPRMETRISLAEKDGRWLMESASKGTRGMAKMLNASSNEFSSGNWVNEYFQQLEYSQSSKIAGRKEHWTAHFDWPEGQVTTRHEAGESILPVKEGTADPVTLTLSLREKLEQGLTHFFVDLVDEDEIRQHEFRTSNATELQTSLGCLEVIPLDRVRENSKRYSGGWYAPSLAYIPVRIRHGKKGGKEYEMRISSLILDGKAVSAVPDCAF